MPPNPNRIYPNVLNYVRLYTPCAVQIPEDFAEQMALKKWAFEYVERKPQLKFVPAWTKM